MVSCMTLMGSTNFRRITGIEVIMVTLIPITINRNTTKELHGRNITQNPLTSISSLTRMSGFGYANFLMISSIEVILIPSIPITIHGHQTMMMMIKNIKSNPFRFIPMISNRSAYHSPDLCLIRRIMMIMMLFMKVSIHRMNMMFRRISKSQNAFIFKTVISSLPHRSGPNLASITGIKMIMMMFGIIPMYRYRSGELMRANVTNNPLTFIIMVASMSRSGRPDFISVSGIEVIGMSFKVITIDGM
jgi:hypothetical protein